METLVCVFLDGAFDGAPDFVVNCALAHKLFEFESIAEANADRLSLLIGRQTERINSVTSRVLMELIAAVSNDLDTTSQRSLVLWVSSRLANGPGLLSA